MASLLSPRRTTARLSLRATTPPEESVVDEAAETGSPTIAWPVAAVGGALASAFFGWILIAGLAVLGWLAAEPGSFWGALRIGTQLWLLGNGAGAELGGTSLTLVPWGATAVFAFMLAKFAAFAARQTRGDTGRAVVGVTAVMTLTYLAPVMTAALLLLREPTRAVHSGLAVVIVLTAAAAWGSARAVGHDPTAGWPDWARSLPRAVLGAELVVLVAGAAALVASLVVHRDRVAALTAALDPGVAGGIALLVAQLVLAPNAIVYAASYVLGAGFALGPASVVAPVGTELGVLPGLPLLGGLPTGAVGDSTELWWLTAGALAGAVAAFIVVRRRPAARFDETSLVGGLAGVVAALGLVVLAWASEGDLGTSRLVGIGPRLAPLLVMAATTMGLAGMITGLVLGLLRRRPR